MGKHSIKSWIVATRPWSFPASVMPVVVTLTYLFWSGCDIDWIVGVWTLVNVVLFHAAGNTWSDYHDYKYGVDSEDTIGGVSITGGEFTAHEIKMLSLTLLSVAVTGGLFLLWLKGLPVLLLGAAGCLLTLLYPWMKYRALGDVDIFLTYSILPMIGTSYVTTGLFYCDVLWLSVPVGLITVAILHANNMRDVQYDRRAKIKTFVMKIGNKASAYIYAFELLLPFVWCVVCMFFGVLPIWSLLVLVALKPAIDNVRSALNYIADGDNVVAHHDELTAKLQLLFSLLLSASFIIAAFV